MVGRSLLFASALLLVAPAARAHVAPARALVDDDDGEHAARTWDDREGGWTTEIAVGNGIGAFGGRDPHDHDARLGGVVFDTTIRLGVHRVRPFRGRSVLGLRASELSGCMPIVMCGGPIGALVGPASGFLGNELGVDLAAHVLHGVSGDAPGLGFAFGVRPTFRVARDSRFRTASTLGSLMPEIGLAFLEGRARQVYVELDLYPIAWTVTRELALEWNVLRERLGVPLDGAPVTVTIGTSVSLVWL